MIVKMELELKYGPNHDHYVYQHQMQEQIDKLKQTMTYCPASLHTCIMDTISILEGIKKQLPIQYCSTNDDIMTIPPKKVKQITLDLTDKEIKHG